LAQEQAAHATEAQRLAAAEAERAAATATLQATLRGLVGGRGAAAAAAGGGGKVTAAVAALDALRAEVATLESQQRVKVRGRRERGRAQ